MEIQGRGAASAMNQWASNGSFSIWPEKSASRGTK